MTSSPKTPRLTTDVAPLQTVQTDSRMGRLHHSGSMSPMTFASSPEGIINQMREEYNANGGMRHTTSLLDCVPGLADVEQYPMLSVDFSGLEEDPESREACYLLCEAIDMREKYLLAMRAPPPMCKARLYSSDDGTSLDVPQVDAVPSASEFLRDFHRLQQICACGPVVSYCLKRLAVLLYNFEFHKLLNDKREAEACKETGTDLVKLTKVDTHIHLAAAMSEEHLLQFILKKLRTSPDEVVMVKNGVPRTLKQVFDDLGLHETSLNVHSLGVRAGSSAFQRFDNFNALYNPFGNSDLRTIFLKTGNLLQGKYFAELTKEVFREIGKTHKKTELRVSVYGRSRKEWDELAAWVERFDVRCPSNRWLIQVPRTYAVWRKQGHVRNFQEFLDNVFGPLFDITEHPEHNPALVALLRDVSGFDSVDDESKPDIDTHMPDPVLWTGDENPPYVYYMYHMYASIARLNQLRAKHGLDPFDFRPHCGESGSERHVLATFLTATGINHGIMLDKTPVAQYLYYLCKIGICVSPLSNNSLFLNYSSNPFPLFFMRGLDVSLSTDDPLQFHYTQSPLTEEYAIASRFWDLSSVDLSEIAKNSVLHCGFPRAMKEEWYGPIGAIPGMCACDPKKTNVPLIRTHFRTNCFDEETRLLLTLSVRHARDRGIPLTPLPVVPRVESADQQQQAAKVDFVPLFSAATTTAATADRGSPGAVAVAEPCLRAVLTEQMPCVVLAAGSDIATSKPRCVERKQSVSMLLPPRFNVDSPDGEDQIYYTSIHIENSVLGRDDKTNAEAFASIPLLNEAIALRHKHQKTWFDRESRSRSKPYPRCVRNLAFVERIQRPGMLGRAVAEEAKYLKQGAAARAAAAEEEPFCPSRSPSRSGDEMDTVLPYRSRLGTFSKMVYSMKGGVFIVYDSQEVFCTNDEAVLATVYCTQCQTDFCERCFEVLHRSEAKRRHRAVRHGTAVPLYVPLPFEEYARDVLRVVEIARSGPVMSTCWTRNHMLLERYNFHVLLHDELEKRAVKCSGTDLYRIVKVDNHIHLNRAVSSNMLLSFIKEKLLVEADTVVVHKRRGEQAGDVTLRGLFEGYGLAPERLSLESMGTHAGSDTFHRYDRWVQKSTPFGHDRLRNLFLSYKNDMQGRYFAELLREALHDTMMCGDPSLRFELRVGLHDLGGYARLARWAVDSGLTRWSSCRFLVQLARDYPKHYARGTVRSFAEYLAALFGPLFDVTKDSAACPELDAFLQAVSGFDCVGNEAAAEAAFTAAPETLPPPAQWTSGEQPPYAYYLYYLNANIQSLNHFRLLTGRNVFDFRPHCGETGDVAHLAAAYLAAKHIAHGTQLRDNPALSYLYYINQIGITASPLSETAVHILVRDNPFPVFFRRGLNVSLSTDNPLMIHMTAEPVAEEYATAAQMWRLSTTDLCEIARNSVLQSGFTMAEKEAWLGPGFARTDLRAHDIARTNVPLVRLRFRFDAYFDELRFLLQDDSTLSSSLSSSLASSSLACASPPAVRSPEPELGSSAAAATADSDADSPLGMETPEFPAAVL